MCTDILPPASHVKQRPTFDLTMPVYFGRMYLLSAPHIADSLYRVTVVYLVGGHTPASRNLETPSELEGGNIPESFTFPYKFPNRGLSLEAERFNYVLSYQQARKVVDEFIRSCSEDDYYYYKVLLMTFPKKITPTEAVAISRQRKSFKLRKMRKLYMELLGKEQGRKFLDIVMRPPEKNRAWNGELLRYRNLEKERMACWVDGRRVS